MNYYLFESPSMGILIAVVVEFLLVMTWAILQGRFRKPLLLIGPALAGLFILLDTLVQTNREALEEARRRFCFEEFLLIQLGVLRQRRAWEAQQAIALQTDQKLLDHLPQVGNLPPDPSEIPRLRLPGSQLVR